MSQRDTRSRWVLAGVLIATVATATAAVPKAVGPQGLLLWASPRPVPALGFEDGGDRPLVLADFRDKIVLLNLWATWCVPCREEMPALDALQATLGGPQFEVLALSIDKTGVDAVQDFYREIGIRYLRRYIDSTATAAPKLGVTGIPTTLLLDRQGRELGRRIGAAQWDAADMVQFVREWIEQTREGVR